MCLDPGGAAGRLALGNHLKRDSGGHERPCQVVERLSITAIRGPERPNRSSLPSSERQGRRVGLAIVTPVLDGLRHHHAWRSTKAKVLGHALLACHLLHLNGLFKPQVGEDRQGCAGERDAQDLLPHLVVRLVVAPEAGQKRGAAVRMHPLTCLRLLAFPQKRSRMLNNHFLHVVLDARPPTWRCWAISRGSKSSFKLE